MAKTALCIGINDYPGTANDLSGCINDAQDWADTLQARGFVVTCLLDSAATKAGMVTEMQQLIGQAQAGDSVIVTYSGHGTWVPDISGDEPDSRDEALCPYDINSGNALLDDEIHQLFAQRAAGVKIVLISDSCHSGTVIRWAGPSADTQGPRVRFLPPAVWLPAERLPRAANGETLARRETRGAQLGGMALAGGDLLMAGCADTEYSYDAYFSRRPNGAFTYFALKTLPTLAANATYADWYKAIRDYLPSSNYPQSPQLFGPRHSRCFKVLD
ncbi:MAG: caspase family protein [Candidatus Competibacteraceae bacterium]|nr:caspase family protein [Candidatus Competibacteraceae bacterium]